MATITLEEMTKFDDVFLGILQNCGKIEPFLDAIFYFLSRRTDFFLLMHKKDDKLGFPPGIAEKMLIKLMFLWFYYVLFCSHGHIVLSKIKKPEVFQKHQDRILKNDPIYMNWKKNNDKTPLSAPIASNEVEVNTTNEPTSSDSVIPKSKDETTAVDLTKVQSPDAQNIKSETVEKVAETKKKTPHAVDENERAEKTRQLNHQSDTFNGGVADHFSWSQTISDVDLKIPVPKSIKKSKELSIEIRTDSLNVSLKNDPPPDSQWESKVICSGTLSHKIRCEESLWSLLPGDQITLNLEKIEQKWWTCVFEGDEQIDKQSIDTTQQVSEFDEQTQTDIRKVMYDQQQKMMGKPTSEEQKTHDMLKKAWDAEGSPFKGTPFDPSRVNISGNGMPPNNLPPPDT